MSSSHVNDESPLPPAGRTRREFLGSAVAVAAAAVAAPALLAACDSTAATAPGEAGTSAPGGASFDHKSGGEPWWTLHHKVESTIGSATNVKIATLEKVTGGYLQRVVTDDSRTGTGLATILRSSHKLPDGSTFYVQVQTSTGKKYYARSIASQADLAYAAKDALATNSLFDGVLQESETTGNPIVIVNKAAVVQFWDGVSSDYYGNHLQVASHTFVELVYSNVAGYKLTATTRDYTHS